MKINSHHGNGLLMWHMFGGKLGTIVIMISPLWHFQIASGGSSECTMVGPLTFARSWKHSA